MFLNRVIYGNLTGNVKRVFSNGTTWMIMDETHELVVRKTKELSRAYASFEGNLYRALHFYDQDGYEGKIIEIYEDGRAKVRYDQSQITQFRSLKYLGFDINCTLKVNCQGQDLSYSY